jgi:hypothetical protein
MLQDGEWGSDLEALAAAEIYQVPVLIWSTCSKAHGFLMKHSVHTSNKGTIHLLHSGNHYDALIPHCKLSNRRQTDSLANSISSHPNNKRPTTSILDSPILRPLQQKKRKVSHEHETKPTPSCCHNIDESEEESGPIMHPCPDKSEPKQNTNLQYSQPKESTAYQSNITIASLQCPALQRPTGGKTQTSSLHD